MWRLKFVFAASPLSTQHKWIKANNVSERSVHVYVLPQTVVSSHLGHDHHHLIKMWLFVFTMMINCSFSDKQQSPTHSLVDKCKQKHMTCFILLWITCWAYFFRRRRCCDGMVTGLTSTCAIGAYHLKNVWVCTPFIARCTLYNIMWSSLSVTCGFLWVPRFPPPIKLTATTEILLKVTLNTIN
jgi:hypothetical protein